MTDTFQEPRTGETSVLTRPPEWIAEPPPAPPSWVAPNAPASDGAGGYGGFGPGGPGGPGGRGSQLPPLTPNKRARGVLTIVIAAALASAAIGVVVGSRLGRTAAAPVAAASAPATGVTPTSPAGATTPNPAVPTGAAAIAAKVTPGIVDINTQLRYQNAAAAGTGMVLTSSGEVLTNNHVVNGATSISVTIPNTGKTYPATVVGTDPTQDVAVIQLNGASGLKTIPTGNSNTVSAGDALVAIGNAGGTGGAPSVVTGTVLGVNQMVTAGDQGGANSETLNGLIETNAPLQPGDSGGPLVNGNGRVIGMDTAASSSARFDGGAAVSFAIPINQALSIAKQIESGQASTTVQIGLPGFLGVAVSPDTTANGAVVTGVASGTPAAAAGLSAGDVITSVVATAVTGAKGLTAALQGHHPGDRVTLGWTSQTGTSKSSTVTLAAGPAN